jgi:hypothetical protein
MSENWEGSIGNVITEQDYLDIMWAEANALISGSISKELLREREEEPEDPNPVRFEEKDAGMRESNHG